MEAASVAVRVVIVFVSPLRPLDVIVIVSSSLIVRAVSDTLPALDEEVLPIATVRLSAVELTNLANEIVPVLAVVLLSPNVATLVVAPAIVTLLAPDWLEVTRVNALLMKLLIVTSDWAVPVINKVSKPEAPAAAAAVGVDEEPISDSVSVPSPPTKTS